jgi:hypothetical protein
MTTKTCSWRNKYNMYSATYTSKQYNVSAINACLKAPCLTRYILLPVGCWYRCSRYPIANNLFQRTETPFYELNLIGIYKCWFLCFCLSMLLIHAFDLISKNKRNIRKERKSNLNKQNSQTLHKALHCEFPCYANWVPFLDDFKYKHSTSPLPLIKQRLVS